jgi:hypothetical protein
MKSSGLRTKKAGPFHAGGSRSFSRQRGGVIFYVFLAVALLAALTYFVTRDSRENTGVQLANKTAQELYVQVNMIRSAIVECTLAHPEGGGDLDASGTIDTTDNPNTPYPLNPYNGAAAYPNSLVPVTTYSASSDNIVRNVACLIGTTSPSTKQMIFQGANTQGRFLPPAPTGFGDWFYSNDSNGVRIKITTTNANDPVALDALSRLRAKFATCQAEINVASEGANVFTAWIQRVTAAACL